MKTLFSWLRGTTIRFRMTAGFASVLLLIVILTAEGIREVNLIDHSMKIINDVNSVKQQYAVDYRGSVHDRSVALRDVVLIGDDAKLEPVIADIRRLEQDYSEASAGMQEIFASRDDITAEERSDLADIEAIEAKAMPLIDKVIVDPSKPLLDGGMAAALLSRVLAREVKSAARKARIPLARPFEKLSERHQNLLLFGCHKGGRGALSDTRFPGLLGLLDDWSDEWSEDILSERHGHGRDEFASPVPCQACGGQRLRPESLAVKVGGVSVAGVSQLPIEKALRFVDGLKLNDRQRQIAGRLVEEGTAEQVLLNSRHPYTQKLLASVPPLHGSTPPDFIPGAPPDLVEPPPGCRFHPRCRYAFELCDREDPPPLEAGSGHSARCWLLRVGHGVTT